MGKNKIRKRKQKYPSRAFAAVYWVIMGLSLPLVFILPIHDLYIYYPYTEGLLVGSAVWGFFFLGSLFYTIHYGLNGIRKCPNCGIQNYKGRKHCKSCGARVFWFCPKCGKKTIKHREFCECGQSLRVITYARQIDFDGETRQSSDKPQPNSSSVVVTGSIVQFCPACGAEVKEDLTHCNICGSGLGHK